MSRPRRFASIFGLWLLVPAAAHADSLTYINDRFGTTITLPVELFDAREDLPANGDGVVFTSQTGARIAVFGQHNAMELDPEGMAEFVRNGIDERADVTYRRTGPDWTVLSGTDPNGIFYERREFGPSGVIHGFSLTYPQAVHSTYDDAVAAIADSLEGP